jgi:uncharacterized repeat protein (TIGR03803 family)
MNYNGTIYKVKADGTGMRIVALLPQEQETYVREDELTCDGEGFLWGVLGSTDLSDGGIYKVNAATGELTTMVRFTGDTGARPGKDPRDRLVTDNAHNLWGVTRFGGLSGYGTIYKINIRTGQFTTVVQFTGSTGTAPGSDPSAPLVDDGAGYFWGTSSAGGADGLGNVFKIHKVTGVMTEVAHFVSGGGSSPQGLDVREGDYFWGTAAGGGAGSNGTVFKVNIDTGVLATVIEFTGSAGARPGFIPSGQLASGGPGSIIGTTLYGGASDNGTLYRVNTVTGAHTLLAEFTGSAGAYPGTSPDSVLLNDGAGSVWGVTSVSGEDFDYGSFFRVNTASGTVTVTRFTGSEGNVKGAEPLAGLLDAGNGVLLGTTSKGGTDYAGTVFSLNRASGALTTIANFDRFDSNLSGYYPIGGLTADAGGTLWGVTAGGQNNSVRGTVFKFNPATNALSTPYQFTSADPFADIGENPGAGLVFDSGFLWGTTLEGGDSFWGTVFKISASTNAVTWVSHFDYWARNPGSPLVKDNFGNFFGITGRGGANEGGTIFKVKASNGELTHIADMPTSNSISRSALVVDSLGYLWGTTAGGGAADYGTIFYVHPTLGQIYPVVEFSGSEGPNKGAYPVGGLVRDADGNFWGTTSGGGASNYGTVFKLDSLGTLTTVAEFTGSSGILKGSNPEATLVADASGILWGSTSGGLSGGYGTIFKVDPVAAVAKHVLEFTGPEGPNYGGAPDKSPLYAHSDGHLYGTTTDDPYASLWQGSGTIFRLHFGPSVETLGTDPGSSTRLYGTVKPNGELTSPFATASFEWGTSPLLPTFETVSAGIATPNNNAVSATLTGLTPGTVYYYRVVAKTDENPNPQRGAIMSFTAQNSSPLDTWRQTWFGSSSNTGKAADLADYDDDGLSNLLEFAFGQNPTLSASRQLPGASVNGTSVEITFPQPEGVSGIVYTAEWSPSLLPNNWTPVPDTGAGSMHTFVTSMTGREKVFMRLVVSVQPQ